MEQQKRKRGRPRLSEEEKAARKKARDEFQKNKKSLNKNSKIKIGNSEFKAITKYILTPSGRCPVPLLEAKEESVSVWLKNIKGLKDKSSGEHTVQSASYWIRDFYGVFTEDYKKVKELVEILGPEIGLMDLSKKLKKERERILKEINDEKIKSELKEKFNEFKV